MYHVTCPTPGVSRHRSCHTENCLRGCPAEEVPEFLTHSSPKVQSASRCRGCLRLHLELVPHPRPVCGRTGGSIRGRPRCLQPRQFAPQRRHPVVQLRQHSRAKRYRRHACRGGVDVDRIAQAADRPHICRRRGRPATLQPFERFISGSGGNVPVVAYFRRASRIACSGSRPRFFRVRHTLIRTPRVAAPRSLWLP